MSARCWPGELGSGHLTVRWWPGELGSGENVANGLEYILTVPTMSQP
jgi:hypothetical protein